MAPLSPSATIRYKLSYTNGYDTHALVMRASAVNNAGANSALQDFLAAIEPNLSIISAFELSVAAVGSNLFNPISWSGPSSYGDGPMPVINRPASYSFVGRTPGGRKARIFLYGLSTINDGSWRILTSEDSDVSAAVAELGTHSGFFLGIDGLAPLWHSYCNVGINDHWLKNVRA